MYRIDLGSNLVFVFIFTFMQQSISYLLITVSIVFCLGCQQERDLRDSQKPRIVGSSSYQLVSDRFEKEVKSFEALDRTNGYMEGGVLFTGSSSIRLWTTLEQDMEGFKVLNRGFGGSTIHEVLKYAPRYLANHRPDAIVFYCGENDINDRASAGLVYERFLAFVDFFDREFPDVEMVYISMKPSASRWSQWGEFKACDELIKAFVTSRSDIEYMDSGMSMFDENNELKKDIFLADSLHMNAKGYSGWRDQLRSILDGLLGSK